MTRVLKLGGWVLLVLLLFMAVAGAVLAYDAGALSAPAIPHDAPVMTAVVRREYGGPAVMRVESLVRPDPAANELLIRVHAAALNPLDWHYLRGTPYVIRPMLGIGRPKSVGLGTDFAGTVVAVGAQVHQFKAGDEIFGTTHHTLAQYATSTEPGLALKPSNVTFEQAAAVPVAGVTALQGLRDYGHLVAGQKVLINGASGGVGSFAVQIAKALGADVTGVCSTRNVGLVRSIGADHVIDYSRDDFTRGDVKYDLVFDTVGNHSPRDYERILNTHGIVVLAGGPSYEPWFGPLLSLLRPTLLAPMLHHEYVNFFADSGRTADFNTLRDLLEAGKLVPVIDRTYPLAQSAAAMQYLEQGHARGKVVITVP